ncbi:hypothetical protein NX059_007492 [Plenodomus lindquistii]|nr:hypothetical protein NX059_007492 [Plenodomus lindquistii]
MTANALASVSKKKDQQSTMSSEEGLALLELAVHKQQTEWENQVKLAAVAEARLEAIEETRRDSAMDTEAMIRVVRELKADREAFTERKQHH